MNTSTSQAVREDPRVMLAHGGGGELMGRLIQDHVLNALGNRTLRELTDGAVMPSASARIVFTTDSFVVQPLEFPGGDIGRLAVCGTVNDLAVMGGRPIGLSLGLIIEEGLDFDRLDRILLSIAHAASEAGVNVVTGDTKVIERSRGNGLFVNTAGVAELDDQTVVGFDRIRPGDAVIINGTIGDHGMAIMSARGGFEFETEIESDAAPLNGLIQSVVCGGIAVRFMRDATRGGVAAVLADIAERTGLPVEIEERRVPHRSDTLAAAEMLGFDLLTVANEGKAVFVVAKEHADACVELMRQHPRGRKAARIGTVGHSGPPLVELLTDTGGRRIVQRPYGEELPRIC